ncbi:MAG: prenyltransferase/squalene oxidase repeat-containing protein [Thiobacillus sp.]
MTGSTYRNRLDRAIDRARAYLLGRQCANGGFSFYRTDYLEEPDPSDTWHAIAALSRLGETTPRLEHVARFVIGQPVSAQPYGLYFRTRVLDLLGETDPESMAVAAAVDVLPTESPDANTRGELCTRLERLRLIIWLKNRFGQTFATTDTARALLAMEASDGGYGMPPNLIDTRMALSCLALCETLPSDRCARFVARLAVPDFGFRLTEQSLLPNLETACAGLACCRRLGIEVPHSDDSLVFILDCQTGNGGFARAPDALPDIHLTHLALIGLETLAGPLSYSTGELP